MTVLQRIRRAFVVGVLGLALLGAAALPAAAAPIAAQKGKSAGKSGGSGKTVHVKEYKRKDGTTVKAHDRKAPKSKDAPDATPATSASSSTSTPKATHASTRCENCDRDSKGRIVRSQDAKKAFEKATGFPHGRPGYVIDHIRPLACGGADLPSNMQWQTIAEAKAKDKTERANCR